jgi:hypothetical protein
MSAKIGMALRLENPGLSPARTGQAKAGPVICRRAKPISGAIERNAIIMGGFVSDLPEVCQGVAPKSTEFISQFAKV